MSPPHLWFDSFKTTLYTRHPAAPCGRRRAAVVHCGTDLDGLVSGSHSGDNHRDDLGFCAGRARHLGVPQVPAAITLRASDRAALLVAQQWRTVPQETALIREEGIRICARLRHHRPGTSNRSDFPDSALAVQRIVHALKIYILSK